MLVARVCTTAFGPQAVEDGNAQRTDEIRVRAAARRGLPEVEAEGQAVWPVGDSSSTSSRRRSTGSVIARCLGQVRR